MDSLASSTPLHGERLIPVEIDRQACETPERLVYSFPRTNKLEDGFVHTNISTYANAINRAAWFIESALGKSEKFDSVGYLGPNDLRYEIFTVALCKTGHKILLISPRNSIEGDLNVIDKASCSTWFLPSQHHRFPNLSKIFVARPDMKVIPVPEASEFLDPTLVKSYPFKRTFRDARKEPLMVLHTSGSTGLPKPIEISHGLLATLDAHKLIPPREGGLRLQSSFWTGAKFYCAFPVFHAAGIYFAVSNVIYQEAHVVFGGDIPITPALIDHVINHEKVQGMMLAPSIIDEAVKSPATYENLKRVDFIVSGGGPLSQETGMKVTAVTNIDNLLGTTEGVTPAAYRVPAEDWQYNHFHECNGFEYRDHGNGLYEQIQVRNPEYELFQGFLKTYPDVKECSTGDLYAKHPTKEGFWIYRGRADDVIVLSNGEKVNPLDIESKINEHPAVRSALVVGQGQFQTALLIELVDTTPLTKEKTNELLKSLWPIVIEANEPAPEHARIQEGCVIFFNPSKPFLRAGKGTCQRAGTIRSYKPEIDEFYAKLDTLEFKEDLDVSSLDTLRVGLQEICSNHVNKAKQKVDVEHDLFAAGFDSLSVITLVRQLRSGLKSHNLDAERIQPSLIYGNPTISSLAEVLFKIIHQSDAEISGSTNEKLMHELFLKYTADLPKSTPASHLPPANAISVILTGSTGSLGSYILESLLNKLNVKSVYCLNRSADAQARQQYISKTNGFNTDFYSLPKVKFLHTDLAESKFGLSDTEYADLQDHATHVIHNAWQVNFNLSLPSFIPHIQGVRNLIEFSAPSKCNKEIFFVSSIGVMQGKKWDGPVKEEVINDYGAAGMGYGASKLVSELILNEAVKAGIIKGTICRVGQIAGPVEKEEGEWNRWEWFPSLIATSKYLKCLPKDLGSLSQIDWIPVDLLATIILELSLPPKSIDLSTLSISPPTAATKFLHTINPNPRTWTSLLPTIQSHLGPDIRTVDFSTWVEMVRESAEKHEAEKNPGVKLLGFFEGLTRLPDGGFGMDVEMAMKGSEGMRGLKGVGAEWMGKWLRQWNFLM